ncbi:MAG: Fe-S protein assembly co-chaperone HscB [Planctomycetota bacterium]
MSPVTARDPFTVFGVPRSLDLDDRQLEQRYLALSRECHPDRFRAQETVDCVAVLARAAEVNDAWRILRDPWQRAKALLEAQRPGVLNRNKKLDPGFLAAALELAEEVAFAKPDAIPALRARLQQALAGDFAALRHHVAGGDLDAAAKQFHASHYHQKALADLDAKS